MRRYSANRFDDSDYFTEEFSAEVRTNGPETKNGIIENSLYVKVRKEPSFDAEVLEVLRKGDRVKILGRDGAFYKVCTSVNAEAYISFEFLKEE